MIGSLVENEIISIIFRIFYDCEVAVQNIENYKFKIELLFGNFIGINALSLKPFTIHVVSHHEWTETPCKHGM